MIVKSEKRHTQRALVLQGGGALGAYEAGVIKVLCKKRSKHNLKQNMEDDDCNPNFHIVAGTSIGAMNGSILVSQYLKTQSWEKAAEKVVEFWTKQLAVKDIDISDLSKKWRDEWSKRNQAVASEETARRYYSVKKLFLGQVRNNMFYSCPMVDDTKFFDKPDLLNTWPLHSSRPLRESIEKYASFPISTEFDKNNDAKLCEQLQKYPQPRLLLFSIDVAEGETVTFDSYPKEDGSRKSEYGDNPKLVIEYDDGISIDHVMASGTVPEFHDYAPIKTQSKGSGQNNKDEACRTNTSDNESTRYFWDGGWLSNTPFRELLEAYQEYWENIQHEEKIPDLEVYIVNVHPKKMDINIIPEYYDGVKDRQHDILYCDRSSKHDEKTSHLLSDYSDFVSKLKVLVDDAVSKVGVESDRKDLVEKLESILDTQTNYKDKKDHTKRYKQLVGRGFNLSKVVRIERKNYVDSISGKIADLTIETINKLIKEGECDAYFALLKEDVKDLEIVDATNKNKCNGLINILDKAADCLRNSNYEDTDSQTYYYLTCIEDEIKKECNIDSYLQSVILQRIEDLKGIL